MSECVCVCVTMCCRQSLLDDQGLNDVNDAAQAVKDATEQRQYNKATELWSVTEGVIEQVGAVRF